MLINTNIEDIVVQERLGGGQFGDVYKAIMKGTIPVAVKMLKNAEAFEDFTNESKVLSSLVHNNVVHYYGTHVSKEGNRYIVTEYMSGGSLMTLLKTEEIFTLKSLVLM